MESKQEFNAAVKRELSRRRERALLGAEARKTQLYSALPQLVELDNEIINAGIRAARLAAGGSSKEDLQQAMDKTGEAEAKRVQLMEENGFTADFTNPRFTCAKCKDTGRVDGVLCSCYTSLLKKLRREAINRNFPLAGTGFDCFSLDLYDSKTDPSLGTSPRAVMAEILDYCKSYAEHFDTRCKSLFFMGDAGLGKTHLALSIASTVLEKGFDVVYVSAQDACSQIEKDNFGKNSETLTAMLEADLLILDDLGTEFVTPFILSALYQLVNTRMGRHLPTIYTTNIMTQQLLITRYTEKVASRLLGSCEILQFVGKDIRLLDK